MAQAHTRRVKVQVPVTLSVTLLHRTDNTKEDVAASPHHTPRHNPTSSSAMAAPSMSAWSAQDEQMG